MSGIVGIVQSGREPVSKKLLEDLTNFMEFRGPDGVHSLCAGYVGFGHASLHTGGESPGITQPLAVEGRLWITADARIDDRQGLIDTMRAGNVEVSGTASDAELILLAYRLWGLECLRYLIGDFSFAVWDGVKERLFCARDHFGIKPFFYTYKKEHFVFSNTLYCLLRHPLISKALHDPAVGDFLLFGSNQDAETTMFADVRRIPPAHFLILSREGMSLRRYWEFPRGKSIRYKKDSDYVEHFHSIFRSAVEDRLRTNRIGISMSGGMDSTSVAVTANSLLKEKCSDYEIRAFTITGEKVPDPEKTFSQMVADFAGFPVEYMNVDDFGLFDGWGMPELKRPYPLDDPLAIIALSDWKRMIGKCKVVLMGSGGDALFYFTRSYFLKLLSEGKISRILSEVFRGVLKAGKLPPLKFRTAIKKKLGLEPPSWESPFPPWVDERFERKHALRERFRKFQRTDVSSPMEHSDAWLILSDPAWTNTFEDWDPGVTRIPIESRLPFYDLRMVEFVLSIPMVPWCIEKQILREAMNGMLPEEVRRRRKTTPATEPLADALPHSNLHRIEHFQPVPELREYVDAARIPPFSTLDVSEDIMQLYTNLRPFALNFWLKDNLYTANSLQ